MGRTAAGTEGTRIEHRDEARKRHVLYCLLACTRYHAREGVQTHRANVTDRPRGSRGACAQAGVVVTHSCPLRGVDRAQVSESMTPPPAASHAARPRALPFRPVPVELGPALGRLLGARAWSRLRFLVDVIVLYLAASAALFAATPAHGTASSHVLAAGFPLLVLVFLHTRRGSDDRLYGSLLDTAANVLGIVSISAMLTVAIDSMLGGIHPLDIAVRLWLFSAVYLGVARMVLLSVRRQAVRTDTFATPTLVVGAGMVGDHLVKRLLAEPSYGLRPVGFLDSDPLPRVTRRLRRCCPCSVASTTSALRSSRPGPGR